MARERGNGIIFEIIRMGDYVKVSAIDPVTMVEVSVVGPSKGPISVVKQVAVQKLRRAIERGA
jgi:hypothetical protein